MSNGNGRWKAVVARGLSVGLLTFVLAAPIGLASDVAVRRLTPALGLTVLVLVVAVGIFFDMIGLAVAVGDEKPFHALAAKRISAATHAMRLVRHADKVSSFANDVVGDIAGTVSGAGAAAVILHLLKPGTAPFADLATGLFVSLAAAITVGGKAAGKKIAISNSFGITLFVGRITAFVQRRTGIDLLYALDGGNGRRTALKRRRKSRK